MELSNRAEPTQEVIFSWASTVCPLATAVCTVVRTQWCSSYLNSRYATSFVRLFYDLNTLKIDSIHLSWWCGLENLGNFGVVSGTFSFRNVRPELV